ncbi:MAG TPA: MarC family protein, partial [bacterium]
VLKAFGLSLPGVQLAGGAVICHMGWQLLVAPPGAPAPGQDVTAGQAPDREGMLFYPVAFPMTTGPGTITVLLTLSANSHVTEPVFYVANLAALAFAAMLICGLVYVSYAYTPYALRWLNTRGYQMVARLSAFLVFCVGLQIAARGIAHLLPPLHP